MKNGSTKLQLPQSKQIQKTLSREKLEILDIIDEKASREIYG